MVTVECDDPAMERALHAPATVLLKQGGTIAPGVVLRAREGEISVAHPAPPADIPLITVPDASLVRTTDNILQLQGNDIVPGSGFQTLSTDQQRILSAQCDVFNLGRKITKTRDRVPRIAYRAAPILLAALLNRRLPDEVDFGAPSSDPPPDILQTFLASRVLTWREKDRPSETKHVLMSLIDYFDHHHDGARYDALASTDQLSVSAAQCGSPKEACFVKYHAGDAHALFVHHGFVDTSTPFIRSARFDLEFPELGLLRIKPGRSRQEHVARRESDRERESPTPTVQNLDADKIDISNLVIKRTGGRSILRRGLAIALLDRLKGRDQVSINQTIDQVEWEVVERTRAYYAGLRDLSIASRGTIDPAPVLALADHQDAVIARYIAEMPNR